MNMRKRVIALSTSLVILGSAPLSISAEEINKSHTDQLSIAQGNVERADYVILISI